MRHKIVFIIILAAIILATLAAYLRFEPRIHTFIDHKRQEYVLAKEHKRMHQPLVEVSANTRLQDEPNAWYTKYHVIAHGCGAIDGRTYTNSKEAIINAYKHGTRVIDADMRYTSDSVLVLNHGWHNNIELFDTPMRKSEILYDKNGHMQYIIRGKKAPSFKQFKNTKIFHKYSPLSCKELLVMMENFSDLYVAPDMKDDVVSSYKYIIDEARKLHADSVLDRIIVNIYDYDMYDKIMALYPFKNVTIRQHYVSPNNYSELIAFCLKKNIHVVNTSSIYMEDEGVKQILSKGIHVYVAVADYISDLQDFQRLGATGCVSSLISEEDYRTTH